MQFKSLQKHISMLTIFAGDCKETQEVMQFVW